MPDTLSASFARSCEDLKAIGSAIDAKDAEIARLREGNATFIAALRQIANSFTPAFAAAIERHEGGGTEALADAEWVEAVAVKPLAEIALKSLPAAKPVSREAPPRFEVAESRKSPGEWRVESLEEDGEVSVCLFCGPNAERRANEYAAIKNA